MCSSERASDPWWVKGSNKRLASITQWNGVPPESDRTTVEAIGRVRKRSGSIGGSRFEQIFSLLLLSYPSDPRARKALASKTRQSLGGNLTGHSSTPGCTRGISRGPPACVCVCVAFLLTFSSLSGRYCINSAVSRNNLDFSSSSTEQRKSVRGAVCPAAIQFRRVISSLESSIVFAASLSAMTLRYTQTKSLYSVSPFNFPPSLSLSLSLASGNLHPYNASGSRSLRQNWKVIHLFAIAILIYIWM